MLLRFSTCISNCQRLVILTHHIGGVERNEKAEEGQIEELPDHEVCVLGRGGGVIQAYSLLSTTHGHITDCKLYSVVHAGVCVLIFNVDLSCLGHTIYARQLLGAKPPMQFHHR